MEFEKRDVRKSVLDDLEKLRADYETRFGKIESEDDRTDIRTLFIEFNKRMGRLPQKKILEEEK